MNQNILYEQEEFSKLLFEKMKTINKAIHEVELYEFCYALANVTPPAGWQSITPEPAESIEKMVGDVNFYTSIQLKPYQNGRMVLDEKILQLLQMLFVGLATGIYGVEWINKHFYFDMRGFIFIHRTNYFNDISLRHLGGIPYRTFKAKQMDFASVQAVGYKAFMAANLEVDQFFIDAMKKMVSHKGTPIIIAVAGQTAAGKTEIVSRLRGEFTKSGRQVTTIEIDNFLTDRDYREEKGIDSKGQDALHYDLFKQSLQDICAGKKISIPRYDFLLATSSHTPEGELKEGCKSIVIEPADIIFMEGNFPFLMPEIAEMIAVKVLYLTSDEIRMKRKWKRDMDYRKKYELMYFLNRYFREQFIMAETCYKPQMEICDMVVDTTRAAVWVTPELQELL